MFFISHAQIFWKVKRKLEQSEVDRKRSKSESRIAARKDFEKIRNATPSKIAVKKKISKFVKPLSVGISTLYTFIFANEAPIQTTIAGQLVQIWILESI